MVDDATDGCLEGMLGLVFEGFIAGTGYFVLSLFGRGRGDGYLTSLLAYAIGLALWIGVGYLAYWLLTR